MEIKNAKIKTDHLNRHAYIYIRQSSLRQIEEHKEGRLRQYQLVDWAVKTGWPREHVSVVDSDQGKSSANPNAREGFAQLVSAVGRGEVGIVVALEATRLARNSPDWHNLIYMCRWTNTLIADEHTIYDPTDSSDRMVLGIRGQMSELELDNSIDRMIQARWNKAKRGELITFVPAGYDIDDSEQIIKTTDEAVAHAIQTVFTKFDELGTARQVFIWWKQNGMQFPVRRCQLRTKPIVWLTPGYNMFLRVLKNPVYAGAYVFGKTQTVRGLKGVDSSQLKLKRIKLEKWPVLIEDHHPAYITFNKFLENQKRMTNNNPMLNADTGEEKGVVREGAALLQGLARCAQCGRPLFVNYGGTRTVRRSKVYQYRCSVARQQGTAPDCQTIGGKRIDECVVKAFFEAVRPGLAQAAEQANQERRRQHDSLQQYWNLQLEKAEYEVQRAYRQYHAVEPENRLVARELERRWNEKLSEQTQVQQKAQEALKGSELLTDEELARVQFLSNDLESVWNASTTSHRDRKHLLRSLIDEVQIKKDVECYNVKIVWKGGAITDRQVERIPQGKTNATSEDTIDLVRRLAQEFDDTQIARTLNRQGRLTGLGNPFTLENIRSLRGRHKIPNAKKSVFDPKEGPFTADQVAKELNMALVTIHRWLREGILTGEQLTQGAPWRIRLTDEVRKRLTGGDAPANWVSLTEAAHRLGVSKSQVAHLVNSGKLKAMRTTVGKRKCWKVEVIAEDSPNQIKLFDQMIIQ